MWKIYHPFAAGEGGKKIFTFFQFLGWNKRIFCGDNDLIFGDAPVYRITWIINLSISYYTKSSLRSTIHAISCHFYVYISDLTVNYMYLLIIRQFSLIMTLHCFELSSKIFQQGFISIFLFPKGQIYCSYDDNLSCLSIYPKVLISLWSFVIFPE